MPNLKLKAAGYRIVDLNDGLIGKVFYFTLHILDDPDDSLYVEEIEGNKIPIIITSQPIIIGKKEQKRPILVPNNNGIIH